MKRWIAALVAALVALGLAVPLTVMLITAQPSCGSAVGSTGAAGAGTGEAGVWLALRAAGLGRAAIARIALALADADPRRDIEAFADDLDGIVAVSAEAARAALAPLTLHQDLRLAIAALTRGSR